MKVSRKICLAALLLCFLAVGSSVNAQGLSPAAPTSAFVFTRNLTVGMGGADVSALQQFLIDQSFLKIETPTAYFGPLTRTALAAWQTSAGISPSAGFFGSLSRAKLSAVVPLAVIPIIAVPSVIASSTIPAAPAAAAASGTGLPMRMIIPTLNVVANVQFNGLKPDFTLEVPTNVTDVGWFTGSVRPGQQGVSIVTGHVAQIRNSVATKPGVFFNLNMLKPGDKLYVINDKGETTTFVVRELRTYDAAADSKDVFTSGDNGTHLNLITCEGVWDQSQLEFSQRLVVFTDAVQ